MRNYIVARTRAGATRYYFFTTKADFDAHIAWCAENGQKPIATYYPCAWGNLSLVGAGVGKYDRVTDDVAGDGATHAGRAARPSQASLEFDLLEEAALDFVAQMVEKFGDTSDE